MQEIAFQNIRNQNFSERGMPPEPPGGVNPLFKKILDPPLELCANCSLILFIDNFLVKHNTDEKLYYDCHYFWSRILIFWS